MAQIQDSLDYLIKSVVTDASSIVINSHQDGETIVFEVTAAPEIVGQIIGKEGKIIKSIRTILNLCYPTVRYVLDIK